MLYFLLPASITKVNSSRSSHPRKHRRGSSLSSPSSSLSSYKANAAKSTSSIMLNGLSGGAVNTNGGYGHTATLGGFNTNINASSTSIGIGGAQSGAQSSGANSNNIQLQQRMPLHRSSSLTSLVSRSSMDQTASPIIAPTARKAEKQKTFGSGALTSGFWSWKA